MTKRTLKPTRRCKTCHIEKPRHHYTDRAHSCQQCHDERIPTRQFADRIIQHANRRAFGWLMVVSSDGLVKHQAAELGISERVFFMWRSGGRPHMNLDRADRLLIDMNLLWFDVFNDDTVRLPILTAKTWQPRLKLTGSGARSRVLELIGTSWYGDLGPDYGELERIQRAFEGDPLEAVA